jgi:hypothetical protein
MKRVAAASGGAITLEDFSRAVAFLPKDSDQKRRRYVTRSLKLVIQAVKSTKRSRKTKAEKEP